MLIPSAFLKRAINFLSSFHLLLNATIELELNRVMSSVKWEPIARSYDPLKAGSIDGTDTVPHDHGVVRAMQVCYIIPSYLTKFF